MLVLNRLGEDAFEALAAANPVALVASVRTAAWYSDRQIVALDHQGRPWLTDGTHALATAQRLLDLDLVALAAGGGTWIGQQVEPVPRVVGELSHQRGLYPMDYAEPAIICDVALDGSVLVLHDREVLYFRGGPHLITPWRVPTGPLQQLPRLSRDGEAVIWVRPDRPAHAVVVFPADPREWTVPLPGVAIGTPRLFNLNDRWWVLALTATTGLTLTPFDDATRGYQWTVPPRLDMVNVGLYEDGQVYVAWEEMRDGSRTGTILRSDGFAPGHALQPIVTFPAAPAGNADPVEAPASGEASAQLPAAPLAPAPAPVPQTDAGAGGRTIEAQLTRIESQLTRIEARLARHWPTTDPAVAVHDQSERITNLETAVLQGFHRLDRAPWWRRWWEALSRYRGD